jgi:hypothetical protein
MLPNARLAKHGYDVHYGFFNGTCWGSGHYPFEIARDCIEKAIQWATEQRTALESSIVKIEAPDAELPFHRYVPGHWWNGARIKSGYQWQTVTLSQPEGQAIQINFGDGKVEPAFRYSLGHTADQITRTLKAQRIAAYRVDVLNRSEYINWQTGRLEKWKPQELREVKR